MLYLFYFFILDFYFLFMCWFYLLIYLDETVYLEILILSLNTHYSAPYGSVCLHCLMDFITISVHIEYREYVHDCISFLMQILFKYPPCTNPCEYST